MLCSLLEWMNIDYQLILNALLPPRSAGRHSSMGGHRGLTEMICMAKKLIPIEKL